MLSLYIHIPFCQNKCNYCSFASFPGIQDSIPAYLEALEKEIERDQKMNMKDEFRDVLSLIEDIVENSEVFRNEEILRNNLCYSCACMCFECHYYSYTLGWLDMLSKNDNNNFQWNHVVEMAKICLSSK